MIHFELRNISKCHGINTDRPVWANRDVNLRIENGKIHGLVGENGAGKSTAMKIIFGLEKPTQGQIFLKEQVCSPHWSPQKAFQANIGMVHQHFMLAPKQSVLDNIVLGAEMTSFFGFRNRKKETEKIEHLMASTGLKVPLLKQLSSLTVSEQSRCEILKVLYRDANFIILDEPTAVLTPSETDALLQTLVTLKNQGKTILIVTHKLGEIIRVADHITVMRAGTTIETFQNKNITIPELAEKMIGRPLQKNKQTGYKKTSASKPWQITAKNLSIEVLPGEIVGIAGIEGNGQQAIIDQITGEAKTFRSTPIAFIPPDRHKEAVILEMSAKDNFSLGQYQMNQPFWAPYTMKEKEISSLFQSEDIRPNAPTLSLKSFSGGNQQKIVVARELFYGPKQPNFILACHPTRGVDLGAIEHIHRHLLLESKRGASMLLISSELEELFSLSHRIAVLHQGRIVAWHTRCTSADNEAPFDESLIGLEMLTGKSSHLNPPKGSIP